MMHLYRVYNGFNGYSAVNVMVIATSEARALELAAEEFKESAEGTSYGESYWTGLEAQLWTEDTSEECVWEVEE